MADSIGSYSFIALKGPLNLPFEKTQAAVRPGVDGATVWLLGRPALPLRLRSVVDCQNFTHARALFLLYQNLIGASTQSMVKDGTSVVGWTFAVLDVQVAEQKAIAGAVGETFNPPSAVLMTCDWLVLPISVV